MERKALDITLPLVEGPCYELPAFDEMKGVKLLPDPAGHHEVSIQFGSSQLPEWGRIRMPLLEAARLHALLGKILADVESQHRRLLQSRPPDPKT